MYHIEWIRGMIAKFPGHPFVALPILSEPDLIEALQSNVTLEPMDELTGVFILLMRYQEV